MGTSADPMIAECASFQAVTPAEAAEEERRALEMFGVVMRVIAGEAVTCEVCNQPVEVREEGSRMSWACPCGRHTGSGHASRRGGSGGRRAR